MQNNPQTSPDNIHTLWKETDICHKRASNKQDTREGATSYVVSAYVGLNLQGRSSHTQTRTCINTQTHIEHIKAFCMCFTLHQPSPLLFQVLLFEHFRLLLLTPLSPGIIVSILRKYGRKEEKLPLRCTHRPTCARF